MGQVELDGGFILDNVLFVPKLSCNLISISQLIDEKNCHVQFTDEFCAIQDRCSVNLIGVGERKGGLYLYRGGLTVATMSPLKIEDFELWHRRMGHPADRITKLVPAIKHSSGSKSLNNAYETCPQAKQSRSNYLVSSSRASRIFEMVHCDLWGRYDTPSSCDAHYFLTLVDDFSRGVWVYLLHSKTDVSSAFRSFFAMISRQ